MNEKICMAPYRDKNDILEFTLQELIDLRNRLTKKIDEIQTPVAQTNQGNGNVSRIVEETAQVGDIVEVLNNDYALGFEIGDRVICIRLGLFKGEKSSELWRMLPEHYKIIKT